MDGDSLKIMNGLLFGARSHPIDDIRNAEMSARFEPQGCPDARLHGRPDGCAGGGSRGLEAW